MSGITTHVLDTARGRPAVCVPVTLARREADGEWVVVGAGVTDEDGRLRTLVRDPAAMAAGVYRITFDTATYFASEDMEGFYPEATIVFTVKDPTEHFHVPLLLSPFGYSTYRGS